MSYTEHSSVLLNECLELLDPEIENPKLYVDLTFGGGGHFNAFAKKYNYQELIGVDQDIDAIENSKIFLKNQNLDHKSNIYYKNFSTFVREDLEGKSVTTMIADLGVSSHHFDKAERGFSFRFDAPLDMRMNLESELTAKKIINEWSEEDLLEIIKDYGEERYAWRIVQRILELRASEEISTTKQLEEICFLSYPKPARHKKPHPATRTFQAFRIAVNRELDVLENSIELMLNSLSVGGKLGIISFHSLEDRIVKHRFKNLYQSSREKYKILTKRPIVGTEGEISENPRARSAKLRVIQKLML